MEKVQRVHSIAGISNLRDVGGYSTRDGKRVRTGRLFRAAHPGGLDAAGLRDLKGLGVSAILDLRGHAERRKDALGNFDGIQVEHLHVPIEPMTAVPIRDLIGRGEATAEALRYVMIDNYRRYVHERSDLFASATACLIDRLENGVMIHCTAGKDRTGFLVAMILTSLDVPAETVMEDYLLTNRTWDGGHGLVPEGMSPEAFQSMRQAHADYLTASLKEIDARHGNMETFLARGLGLDTMRRTRLRDLLLTD